MWYGDSMMRGSFGFGSFFSGITWILFIVLLIALIRLVWKKGDKK